MSNKSTKTESIMQEYDMPQTLFLHATESQISQILKNQALHHRLLSNCQSPMKTFNINGLNEATKRQRKANMKKLAKKWQHNIGIPLSIQNSISENEMIELAFRLYQEKASLNKIYNGHSEYHISTQKSKNNEHDRYNKLSANTKQRRMKAYQKLKQSVFSKYGIINKNDNNNNNNEKKQFKPQPPTTKPNTNSENQSPLKQRNLSNIKLIQEKESTDNDHNDNNNENNNKISKISKFSDELKLEMSKLKNKQSKKNEKLRLIQSARKHKDTDNMHARTKKKQISGNWTARTAKTNRKINQNAGKDSITVIEKILSKAGTQEAAKLYGNTVPAFRAAFVKELHKYSKEKLKNMHKHGDAVIKVSIENSATKPQFESKVGQSGVFTGRRASAFAEYGKKEASYNESKFVKRQAYGNMVKQNIKVTIKSNKLNDENKSDAPKLNAKKIVWH